MYANSNGLESIFQNNKKITHLEVERIIETQLKQQIGPTDLIVMLNALKFASEREFDKISELDMKANSMKNIKEVREASKRSGIQLAKCVKEFVNDKILEKYLEFHQKGTADGAYPVSFGLCANALGIDPQKAGLMFLYGFVVSVAGAASRMGIIQHYQAQKTIHELKPLIIKIVRESLDKSTKDIWQFAPHLEILQMHHDRMDSKMFIT
ncbi:urease accessory protein UreF [Candidatus Nitrosotenuis sp. DW1]|uniref:urease accessory protein UreF n=1 Tax=Candidatus Nitrosotenuis sp. DW1 TaxID=2259672 RepID=UPI0015CE7F07|nr:urease accessory UreF family protein [Candidatus Nitrosotenuis sp. DW1]